MKEEAKEKQDEKVFVGFFVSVFSLLLVFFLF